jgi:hypothetical protein
MFGRGLSRSVSSFYQKQRTNFNTLSILYINLGVNKGATTNLEGSSFSLPRASTVMPFGGQQRTPFLRNNNLKLFEDLSPTDREKRNKLWPLVDKARRDNKRAYFVGGRAFVEGTKFFLIVFTVVCCAHFYAHIFFSLSQRVIYIIYIYIKDTYILWFSLFTHLMLEG